MSDDSPIRVLIADEPAHARAGLRAVLEGADDVVVVGEAEDGEDAIRKAAELHPDIVFMDPQTLGLSPHSVKTQLERIFEKVGANDGPRNIGDDPA